MVRTALRNCICSIIETGIINVNMNQVSRCGMIYMEPKGLGWKCLMESWLNTLPPSLHSVNRNLIRTLFNRFLSPLLWLVEYSGKAKVFIIILPI